MNHVPSASPFDIKNIRYFIAFRIFFNSRFYYPVFTILFLDFGLTIEQFALLNAAWAASIAALEVPSGALADVIGRKRLLVLTGIIMVFEITLLCFAPKGSVTLLFYTLTLTNSLLSMTRYVLINVPLFITAAVLLQDLKKTKALILGVLSMMLLIYSAMFAQWYWVG